LATHHLKKKKEKEKSAEEKSVNIGKDILHTIKKEIVSHHKSISQLEPKWTNSLQENRSLATTQSRR
jgi:hypothetical protein